MTEETWTFYTLDEWWNPLLWQWWPIFHRTESFVRCAFLFFAIKREW